jgi:hypothetical protein
MNKQQYVLAIVPTPNKEIDDFFSRENKFIDILEKPNYLRYTGWNTRTLDKAELKNAKYWVVKNGDRKEFRFFIDGSLLGAVDADDSFLCWGREESNLINSLAIIEYTYEFVKMYADLISSLKKEVDEHVIKVHLDTFSPEKQVYLNLSKGRVRDPFWKFHMNVKSLEENVDKTLVEKELIPERIAYKIVEHVFASAGFTSDEIPYVKNNEDNKKVIDTEDIKAVG